MTLQQKFESANEMLNTMQARHQELTINIQRLIGRLQTLEELMQEQKSANVTDSSVEEVRYGGQE